MPKTTGAELIQIVHERWPDLRFILATGYAEQPVGFSPVTNLPRLAKLFWQALSDDLSVRWGRSASGDQWRALTPSPEDDDQNRTLLIRHTAWLAGWLA